MIGGGVTLHQVVFREEGQDGTLLLAEFWRFVAPLARNACPVVQQYHSTIAWKARGAPASRTVGNSLLAPETSTCSYQASFRERDVSGGGLRGCDAASSFATSFSCAAHALLLYCMHMVRLLSRRAILLFFPSTIGVDTTQRICVNPSSSSIRVPQTVQG